MRGSSFRRVVLLAGLGIALGSDPSAATDGYFRNGYGARHGALAGAGVADGKDATAAALNPAGLVNAPSEISMAVSAFMPHRYVHGSGAPGFTPLGTIDSDSNLFLIPNMAMTYRLGPGAPVDVIALTVYGNGGMNTDYPAVVGGAACPIAGAGVFCGFDRTGVNLQQAFISLAFAKRFGTLAIGFAPILARQQFEANGISQFGVLGNVTDVAWGVGARAGIEWSAMPGLRIGVAGNTRIYMERFEKYANLFAEQGDFDVPPSLQAGIAVDIHRDLTLMLDYKRIWYSQVASVGNPSANALLAPFGADNGPGFGWRDIDMIKIGLEWRASDKATLRAGYSYNTNPIRPEDVMLNILAPGVVQHHVTGGLMYQLNQNWVAEFAAMYAPRTRVQGAELPGFGNPAHGVEIGMHQYEVTFGFKYMLGSAPRRN